jgi:hypothetical protein
MGSNATSAEEVSEGRGSQRGGWKLPDADTEQYSAHARFHRSCSRLVTIGHAIRKRNSHY